MPARLDGVPVGAWFGEPWPGLVDRAPVCEDDALRVDTPVGLPCFWCDEDIRPGDRGSFIQGMPIHVECSMRQVLGGPAHLHGGRCVHCGGTEEPDQGLGARQAAIKVWHGYHRGAI